MKKSTILSAGLFLLMLLISLPAAAQSVAKWTASAKMTSKTEGVITLTATIDKGWHIYGLDMNDDGPVPTEITFDLPKGVTLVGKPVPSRKPVVQQDDMFGCEVSFWENKVTFTQKIKVDKKVNKATAKVSVSYMSCNDSSCRPPCTEELTVKIK